MRSLAHSTATNVMNTIILETLMPMGLLTPPPSPPGKKDLEISQQQLGKIAKTIWQEQGW
ncbi:hypothetical protein N7463_001973 [Penicillium fimorum]|uniref:Uncharacterized protein n=1 Tax=Penicillium fimorum TaxID=1882269 RepID=A0A9X0C823_9EURO|nr:hypothetical protein N7463_001973 [Penicillium fimorum]